MTFEKILDVFHDYLQQDPLYEVVLTSHGYTLLSWEPQRGEWYRAELTDTPKKLLEALLDCYAEFLEEQITGNDRDLNEGEQAGVDDKCAEMKRRCLEP